MSGLPAGQPPAAGLISVGGPCSAGTCRFGKLYIGSDRGEYTWPAHSARTDFADGGANVLIQTVPQDGIKLEEEDGLVSFLYGKKEPRRALRFRAVKMTETPAVRFVTVVSPYLGQKPPKVSVKPVGAAQAGESRVELEVTVGETAARIGYDLKEKKAWLKPL